MKLEMLKPNQETIGVERTRVTVDEKSGLKTIDREIGGEIVERTLKDSKGDQISYVNFEKISELENQERILKMMGIKVSPAIWDLVESDETQKKYYIKFLPPDNKK